jgi:hypothetical protein
MDSLKDIGKILMFHVIMMAVVVTFTRVLCGFDKNVKCVSTIPV